MLIRLEAAGHFLEADKPTDLGNSLDRPVMLVYTGDFESMDGPVKISDGDIENLAKNHNGFLSRLSRLATGEVPMKHCPPLQLDHSPSATMTVGRLIGDLKVGETQISVQAQGHDPVWETRKALLGTVRVLGRENVEKVLDGRWTHVSIGADLASHKVNELSLTPFPAAANASLLAHKRLHADWHVCERGKMDGVDYRIETDSDRSVYRGYCMGMELDEDYKTIAQVKAAIQRLIEEKTKGERMSWKAKLSKLFKLGEGDDEKKKADEKAEKMKKHLMDDQKMSAEDAEKKLAGMDEAECSKLASDIDEKEKKLAAEEDEAKKKLAAEDAEKKKKEDEAKMAAKAQFITLAKGLKTKSADIQMAAKMEHIHARLGKLRASAKITPAEVKKLDVVSMSKLPKEALEAVLSTYDKREPVIDPKVYGTTKAVELAKVTKEFRLKKLELEMRLAMPSKKKAAEESIKRLMEEEKAAMAKVDSQDEKTALQHYSLAYDEVCKMLDDGRDKEAVKAALKRMLDEGQSQMGEAAVGDEKRMSALDESVKALQNQFQELTTLVGPVLGVATSELE